MPIVSKSDLVIANRELADRNVDLEARCLNLIDFIIAVVGTECVGPCAPTMTCREASPGGSGWCNSCRAVEVLWGNRAAREGK